MRFSPHTAPRSILLKSLDPFPCSRISSRLPLPSEDRTNSVTFSFILNLGSSISFLFTYSLFFFYFIPFHHSLSPIDLILYNLTHFLIKRKVRNKLDWFFDQKYYVKSSVFSSFSIPIRRYSVWINREPFLLYLYKSILLHSNSFPIPPKENPESDPKLTG